MILKNGHLYFGLYLYNFIYIWRNYKQTYFQAKNQYMGARLSVLNAVVTPDPVICESLHILLIWKTLAWPHDFNKKGGLDP
jgi:hypothetical protein